MAKKKARNRLPIRPRAEIDRRRTRSSRAALPLPLGEIAACIPTPPEDQPLAFQRPPRGRRCGYFQTPNWTNALPFLMRRSVSSSKCIGKVCQGKSEVSGRFSARKHHIFRDAAPSAAIRGINVPIRAPKIVPWTESQFARGSVNRARGALQLQIRPDRCFIQVQMQTPQPKGRAELLIAKSGAQPQRAQPSRPSRRPFDFHLALGPFLISRATRIRLASRLRGRRRLEREHSPAQSARQGMGR